MPWHSRSSNDQARYRILIDAIPYGFYAVDADGRITDANPALSELLGYPRNELVGSLFERFLPDDEIPGAERLFRETMSGAVDMVELDIWVRRRDDTRRLVHMAARAIQDGGAVVGTHGIVRDVTEDREAADRVRRSEQRLRLLLDRMPAILWTVDRDLCFTSGSGGGLAALGLKENELVGASLFEYFGTSDPDFRPIRAHRGALAGNARTFRFESRGRSFEVRVEPLRVEGEVTGAIGAALDVTERVETKRKLEEQRAHRRRLFEAAPEAIVLLDSEDRVVESNPEFERLFGYSAEEARGREINDLIVPRDRSGEASGLSRRVADGERIDVEAIRRHKDGTRLDVSILGTPVDVGEEQWVYGIYRDITGQKELQEQLLHSQRLEAVGQLAGGIAHDFNNVLTAILGHARILVNEVPEGWIRDDLREIETAAERAAALTRQLLTFSRRQVAERRDVDVSRVIEAMRGMLRPLIGDHVELHMALHPDLPPVSMDPGQLEQVVMNLVINARDAVPDGGRVTVTTALSALHIVLEVADTGTGMTDEERTRMFEPFFTTKEAGKGTGLGLSTVYGIVEQSGGWIDVETERGEGTVIRVHIPAVAGECQPPPAPENGPEPVARPSRAGEGESGGAGHERILLVDNDRPVRMVTLRILERQGYTVIAASSGSEAIELARSLDVPPDLLLTDLVMPGMSGQALGAKIRDLFPSTAVLFMSGYTEADLDRGTAGNFMAKPFDVSTLSRRVREALG